MGSAAYVMARRGSTNDVAKTLSTTSADGRAPSRAPVREKAANRSSSPKGSPRRTRLRSPCSSPKSTQRGQAAFETPNLLLAQLKAELGHSGAPPPTNDRLVLAMKQKQERYSGLVDVFEELEARGPSAYMAAEIPGFATEWDDADVPAEASTKLQGWRREIVRRGVSATSMRLLEASTVVQSAWRGHKVRKQVVRRKRAEADLRGYRWTHLEPNEPEPASRYSSAKLSSSPRPMVPIVDSSTEQQRLSEAIARRRDQRRRIPVGRGLAA